MICWLSLQFLDPMSHTRQLCFPYVSMPWFLQCIISVYIFSGAIIFLCCCCSCIIWCCRGCPLPNVKKKIKRRHKIQKKSSSSIQYEKHKSTNVEEGLEWKIQEMIALKLQEQKICSDTSLSEMKKQSASDII